MFRDFITKFGAVVATLMAPEVSLSRRLSTLLAAAALLLFCLQPLSSSAEVIAEGEVLTLSRAIEIALKTQPSIMASHFAVRAGEARIGEAKSTYYPQINASGSYSRVSSPSTSARSSSLSAAGINADTGPIDTYTSNIGLNQTVYDFGKTSTQVKISTLNTESSRFDLVNIQQAVVLNVKQAYYNALQARRNRDVATQTVKQFQQHLDQARGFFEVGTKAKFDVTKAEVDLSNAQVNLIRAENQVRLALVALNSAMGVTGDPDYRTEDNLLYARYELTFEEAIERAYANRPDLQSLIKKKDASKESIALAKKGYYPIVSANASYFYTGSDFPIRDGWSYGLNLSAPIFSGYLTKYQVAEAQANFGTVSANERSLRLDIYSQVQQGYLTLREAAERLAASEVTVRQAQENVELATGRYDAGVGSPLEVTDAIVAQANAEVARTAALTDYKNAQASIEKAIGEK
jgi:outer membrane protein TolC